MPGNLLPNNCQRDCPPKQFVVGISHVSCTCELKRSCDKVGKEIQESTQEGETHEHSNAACTYRAMVTHLSLFDDTVACRYVAHIASTTSTKYMPVDYRRRSVVLGRGSKRWGSPNKPDKQVNVIAAICNVCKASADMVTCWVGRVMKVADTWPLNARRARCQ